MPDVWFRSTRSGLPSPFRSANDTGRQFTSGMLNICSALVIVTPDISTAIVRPSVDRRHTASTLPSLFRSTAPGTCQGLGTVVADALPDTVVPFM